MAQHISEIRIACWNTRGYLASTPYIRQLLEEHDILAISEHWVFENRLYKLSEISDTHHCFARASRLAPAEDYGKGRGQGGVAVFWDKRITCITAVSNIILDRACAIRMQTLSGSIIYFVSLYLPANGSRESLDASLDEVSELINSREAQAHVILLGDFNGDVGSSGGPRGYRTPTARGSKVMAFFNRHDLIPVNMHQCTTGPVDTYEGQVSCTTLDYIAVPSCILPSVTASKVYEQSALNTSDHVPLSATLSLGGFKRAASDEQNCKGRIKWEKLTPYLRFVKYQKVLEPTLNDMRLEFNRGSRTESDIELSFNKLSEVLRSVSDTLPHTKYKCNLKPYWNRELTTLKRNKVTSYHNWVSQGRPRAADNNLYMKYKFDKNLFHKRIKAISKRYENDEIVDAVKSCELNRNAFWKLIQKARKSLVKGVSAIRGDDEKVVNELEDVLQVWSKHFEKIGNNAESDSFDERHYHNVSRFVCEYNKTKGVDDFMTNSFTYDEIYKAINTLHTGKAPGHDNIMSEHIQLAGRPMVEILCTLFNAIMEREYIPVCFKRGVQVPLYKGKDTCILDPNNYRGITLLPTFNKILDVLIWQRIKKWWHDENIISELQGACREGASCVHTAFTLAETVATSMEANSKCFVAFFDVAKAFDTVWIDGLFQQIYDLGIQGRTWRLLYRGYVGFKCCVKLQGRHSGWYELQRGIHQGGFLSLMKYTIFINSLLVKLKETKICCKIYTTPSTPLGYADDVATCCLSKRKLDHAMDIVHSHGRTWRYQLNAKKSGVLVFGESAADHERNSLERVFKLGPNKVKERKFYDHVGIRNCIFQDEVSGIEERIAKGRKAFNAIAGIGVRKGGLTMSTCSVIYWSVIVPTTLFGCELWVMNATKLDILEEFQNYVGKRIQRFHPRIPNACSTYGLGWMRLERVIQVKKLMFIRTIMIMKDGSVPKTVFCERAKFYCDNESFSARNDQCSPVFDMLNVCTIFGFLEIVKDMVTKQHYYSKGTWREMVWKKGWDLEDTYWHIESRLHRSLNLLKAVNSDSRYLVWWTISDKNPSLTKKCEAMAKIISHASTLRNDDLKLKSQSNVMKMCNLCDLYQIEDARHLILHCPFLQELRNEMMMLIDNLGDEVRDAISAANVDILYILLGYTLEGLNIELMDELRMISLEFISRMYHISVNKKRGIG